MSKNMMIFIGRIALEYRLSLKNVCILLKLEPTEENTTNIYNEITKDENLSYSLRDSYKYLFYYETNTESKEESAKALKDASNFITQYNKAQKSGNKEEVKNIMELLHKTDINFKQLKETKDFSKPLTQEEQEIITKYRIKYCISNSSIANVLNVDRDRLRYNERKIEDSVLNKKAVMLSEYYEDVTRNAYRRRK